MNQFSRTEIPRWGRVTAEPHDLSEARLREISLTQTMPQLAQAFRNSFDHISVTTTDTDPFSVLGTGIERVMRAARGNM